MALIASLAACQATGDDLPRPRDPPNIDTPYRAPTFDGLPAKRSVVLTWPSAETPVGATVVYSKDPDCDLERVEACPGGGRRPVTGATMTVDGLDNDVVYHFWLVREESSGPLAVVDAIARRPAPWGTNGGVVHTAFHPSADASDGPNGEVTFHGPHEDAASGGPHEDAAFRGPHEDAAFRGPHEDAAFRGPHEDALLIAGLFSYVGPPTGAAVVLDPSRGRLGPPMPIVDGEILAAAPDGAGGWYLGGTFTQVGNADRPWLARVSADGQVVPWGPRPDGPIYAILPSDDRVFIGGRFTRLDDARRSHLAQLDAATGAVRAPLGGPDEAGPQVAVRALARAADVLYAGGSFERFGPARRRNLVAIELRDDGGVSVLPWAPEPDGPVFAIALAGETVYVAAEMRELGGAPRLGLGAVDATTGQATDFAPAPSGRVHAILVDDDRLYAAGAFTAIGGTDRAYLAALDPATGDALDWGPMIDNDVWALVRVEDHLLVGGDFDSVDGATRHRFAALDRADGRATVWRAPADGRIRALVPSGPRVLAAGAFTSAGGRPATGLAALAADTTVGSAFGLDGPVDALAVHGDRVYVAGLFTAAQEQPRAGLAAFDLATHAVTAWRPDVEGRVTSLLATPDRIVLGGRIDGVAGEPRTHLAAVDPDTGDALAFAPALDAPVLAMAGDIERLFVVGRFTAVDGRPRRFAAAFGRAGALTPWSPNPDRPPEALVTRGDTVFVGGRFDEIGGGVRPGLAPVDATTGTLRAWPEAPATTEVTALELADGRLYVGGAPFADGSPSRLRAIDAATGAVLPWNPDAAGAVWSLTAAEGRVFVGGVFTRVGPAPRRNYAIIDAETGRAD